MARILVVNDDAHILELYQDALAQLGHEVVAKETTDSGPDTVREVEAQALVVDLQQPDEDQYGLRIIEQMRSDPALKDFPIILATGAGPDLDPISARLVELRVPILEKPFAIAELGTAITFALSGTIRGE
jgi:DNA-binding response OmpR family regulator